MDSGTYCHQCPAQPGLPRQWIVRVLFRFACDQNFPILPPISIKPRDSPLPSIYSPTHYPQYVIYLVLNPLS